MTIQPVAVPTAQPTYAFGKRYAVGNPGSFIGTRFGADGNPTAPTPRSTIAPAATLKLGRCVTDPGGTIAGCIPQNSNGHTLIVTIATAHDPNIKYGPEGRVAAGSVLDYRVEYENEGEGTAYGVYFTDTLDPNLDEATLTIGPVYSTVNNSVIAQAGNYDPATRAVTWLVGEVGPGAGGYANISARVRGTAATDTKIINYGIVNFPSVPEQTKTNSIVSIVGLVHPPGSVTGLRNVSYEPTSITWAWTDPADEDLANMTVYVDNAYQGTVSAGTQFFTPTPSRPAHPTQ